MNMDQAGSSSMPLGICTEDLSVWFLLHSIVSGLCDLEHFTKLLWASSYLAVIIAKGGSIK